VSQSSARNFSQLIVIATLNWPTHRGTATAFPLAAFGLSAFFYTVIAGFAFPGNTSGFLLLLSLATSLLVLVSVPFLIVVDHQKGTGYAVLPTTERTRRDSNLLHQTKTNSSEELSLEPSKYCFSFSPCYPCHMPIIYTSDNDEQDGDSDEISSLLSGPGDIVEPDDDAQSNTTQRSQWLDVTGLDLFYRIEFWQLWILLGLLTGVGLMTIKYVLHLTCVIQH
jgi:hypothetical protein